ncbi:MAG: GNAT family N-acetyltransferase [Ruminococcaceae bacterium]|nr:GNAT family N-acetyltransferase [Oscillospiraceae bacterium]
MVRIATIEDLPRVNELRQQVNDLHVAGRPHHFKAGFPEELQEHAKVYLEENHDILVAEREGVICGFACVSYVERAETPYSYARRYYEIEEFGVDPAYHRQGVATELFAYMKEEARTRDFERIELNMWEFNASALAFYEAMGMKTYRRYLELEL